MKARKKLCIAVTVLALLVSGTACGSSDGEGDNAAQGNQEELIDVTVNRPVLSGLYPNSGMRDTEFKSSMTTELYETMTGYQVEYYQIAGSDEESEVGNALMNEETYSFIKMQRGSFDQYVVQDAFLDLTELLQNYGQNLLETIPEELWEACTYEGKIYAIPEYGFGYMMDYAFLFNTEHLEQAGITKIPETLTEFTDTILKLQEVLGADNPNYHAMAMTGAEADLRILGGAFDMPIEFYEDENGIIKNYIYSENTYNYLKYMNMLFKQNCLAPSWEAAQEAQLMNWFTNQNISVVSLPYWYVLPLAEQMSANNNSKYPTVEDALASIQWQNAIKGDGSYGTAVQEEGKVRGRDDIGYFICIPYQSEETAAYAIDWMNTRITDENYKTFFTGEEGVTYQIVSEAEATETDVPIVEADGSTRYYRLLPAFASIKTNSMYATGGNREIGRRFWALREADYQCWDILLSEEQEGNVITSALAKCPVLPEWSKISIKARSLILTYIQRMINATEDTGRTSLDGYLASLKDVFEKSYWTEACAQEVQEWYDSKKE